MMFVNWEHSATTTAQKQELSEKMVKAIMNTSPAKGGMVAYQDMVCYPPAPGPIISVRWTEGNSDEVKDAAVKALTDAVCEVTGHPAKGIKVIFDEIRPGNLDRKSVV